MDFDEDDDELDLFVEAQDSVWTDVILELKRGKKESHWMWFVFPQLAELGQSDMSQLYGLADLEEASAYYDRKILRERLDTAAQLILAHDGKSAKDIMGRVDSMKLRSSATLFAAVPGAAPHYQAILDRFYDGKPCPDTVAAIA